MGLTGPLCRKSIVVLKEPSRKDASYYKAEVLDNQGSDLNADSLRRTRDKDEETIEKHESGSI